ncbi:MAG: peptidase [Actinomycetes bacterium]
MKPAERESISIRLLDASAARRDDPRARIYIDDNLKPGATIVRHIEVSNSASRAVSLRYYADAATVAKGSFTVAAGQTQNELTRWMTVTPAAGTLPPQGHVVLTVTIKVPTDVQPGERYGVVLADVPPARPTRPSQLAVGARVGIRVYLSVSRRAEPVTDFRIDSLTALRTKSGQPEVLSQVHNTGGRAVDLSGTLMLDHGPGGLRAGPYPVALGTTLGVGQTAPVAIPLDRQLPAGPWRAVLTLASGSVTRAAQGMLLFPTANGVSSPVVAAKPLSITQRRSIVVPVAGGLLGLLALAFLLFLLLRRRRKDDDDDNAGNGKPSAPTRSRVLTASRHS